MDDAMKFAIESSLNNDDEIFRDVYDKNYTIESVDSRIKNILSIEWIYQNKISLKKLHIETLYV